MKAYLSGAMEQARDEGAGWRERITDWLKSNLGHGVINPVEETGILVAKEGAFDYRQWKNSDPERFIQFVRKLIDRDIKAVTKEADYVICYWNKDVLKGGGTHGEVTLAYHYGIPVFLVNELPQQDLSGWILSCSTEVFENFRTLQERLLELYRESDD